MDSLLKEQLIKTMLSSKKMLMMTTASAGVPFAEFVTLMHIFHLSQEADAKDGVRVMRIKEMTHISLPAVSQQVRTLEEKGLVVRSIRAKDRRISLVALTPAGHDVLKRVRENTDAVMEELVLKVGEETIREYIRITDTVMKSLTEMRGATPDNVHPDCFH